MPNRPISTTPRTRLTTVLAALLVATTAGASDPVMLPEAAHARWQAIGRLNVIGHKTRRMCTATLIAPDKVLSAAHCVLFGDGREIPPERLRFVPGWFRGAYPLTAQIDSVARIEPFRQAIERGETPLVSDHAILSLNAPITTIAPLPTAGPDPNGQLRILGYRWDRPHALSDTGPCAFRPLPKGGLQMDCAATFGNSGGPVLQHQKGEWHVVGVVSAIGRGWTYGAPLP